MDLWGHDGFNLGRGYLKITPSQIEITLSPIVPLTKIMYNKLVKQIILLEQECNECHTWRYTESSDQMNLRM